MTIKLIITLGLKCATKWYRMWIFYSHFYWLFTCIWKQILPANIFRKLCLKNYKETYDRLSYWKSFWRLDIINALLR